MKILKRILVILIVIIAIPLVLALFVKKDYAVEKEVTINKPVAEVFNYVRFLGNQDNFNEWILMDPALKKDLKGTDGTVGFVYAWDGEKAGAGEQEIKSIKENERIDMDIRFRRPMEGAGLVHFITEPVSANQTKLKWGMEGKSSYPLNFMNLFSNWTMGKPLQQGLENIKGILEK